MAHFKCSIIILTSKDMYCLVLKIENTYQWITLPWKVRLNFEPFSTRTIIWTWNWRKSCYSCSNITMESETFYCHYNLFLCVTDILFIISNLRNRNLYIYLKVIREDHNLSTTVYYHTEVNVLNEVETLITTYPKSFMCHTTEVYLHPQGNGMLQWSIWFETIHALSNHSHFP